MRQTICVIPHELLGLPVFGWGWALAVWVAIALIATWMTFRRFGWNTETRGQLVMATVVAAVLVFVLPAIEVRLPDGRIGIPIRGYGVMLLIAVVAGVGLAMYLATRHGMHQDVILALAVPMFVTAIVGARTFFVIQYWDYYRSTPFPEVLLKIVNITVGGLVVYGALIGGLLAAAWFFYRHKLPVLVMADLISPSLILGLSIGRLGCLMNGCCYGGVSDVPWALTFPPEAAPYETQLQSGDFHGMRLEQRDDSHLYVTLRDPQGAAARAHLPDGARLAAINGHAIDPPTPALLEQLHQGMEIETGADGISTLEVAQILLADGRDRVALTTDDGRDFGWTLSPFPTRSLPVHPTQIYASVNALCIFLFLLAYLPFRRRDGEVFAILMTIYPITRFLLEIVRTDEGSFWQTGLTISQNVSILLLGGAVCLWLYLLRQPARPNVGTFWERPASEYRS
ncbi:MAG: prolipoprotein diacylglyceryl transferase [Planctomycetales bacterium]|nr:prolipoprotein diacylglyceryl transferase [Planctomycetales bacterium]